MATALNLAKHSWLGAHSYCRKTYYYDFVK